MEQFAIILIALLCFLVVYAAAFATYHVSQSELFESHQLYAIYAIAWLVPFIGPAIIISIVWPDIRARRKPGIPLLGYLFLASTQSESEDSLRGSETGGNHSGSNIGGSDDF